MTAIPRPSAEKPLDPRPTGPAAGRGHGEPFWGWSRDETIARVASSEGGLSAAEARERLARFGGNEIVPARRFQALRELGRYLGNPLVLILLVASAVSAALGAARERRHRRACAGAERRAELPTPAARWLGFVPLPPAFFLFLAAMVASYLAAVEIAKGWFYRRYAA